MVDYTQGIYIDGTYFNVPLLSIKRSADFLDKFAERTEDGDMARELIGVYYNYQMSFGTIDDDKLYSVLWNKLTEPTEFHDFMLPDTSGNHSFRGYVSNVSDEYDKILSGGAKFKGLTCKFISKKPTKVPT